MSDEDGARPARPAFPDGHFYSPVVDVAEVSKDRERIWGAPWVLSGVDFDDEGQRELLTRVLAAHLPAYDYPDEPVEGASPYQFHTRNTQFSWLDSRTLFAVLREKRPRRVIEVGSGFSSLLIADVNRRFLGGTCEVTCVEPYPRAFLKEGVPGLTTLIESRVQDVPLQLFDSLEDGDILFVDSSHVSKTGSDVNVLLLEVLPRLRPGVWIHFHDVFFPRDYPYAWVVEEGRSWNEQYVLAAFLMFNREFRVRFGCAYALDRLPELLRGVIGEPLYGGGSLWIERVLSGSER